jgi:hypothetical protein
MVLGDGGVLAIPITGYLIFSQLRGQRSANRVNAMEELRDEWDSERVARHRLAVLMHHAEGKPGWPPALTGVGNFFGQMGYLVGCH